ncbi:DUF3472 domain-containing protein [Pedobacter chinensis]|uniref:DUF3472 domain-containing protein n=1 Tax=Pedobacter chinensis TaxID=2282421 RepID=A0A369Q283_9SPHI|nr:DUF3472 domain-containing protein [Pedobacter chinensis]RDC57059.1 DUF3472 domain-containing protein [Pedobacter chinensis]
MKAFKLLSLIVLGGMSLKSQAQTQTNISLPLGGNAYSSLHQDSERTLSNRGIVNWTNPKEYFTAYFRVSKPGTVAVSIDGKPMVEGQSTLAFSINNQSKEISFDESKTFDGKIGEWIIKDTGYVALTIKGINKTGGKFPSIAGLFISGTALEGNVAYVKNNEGNFFHWGRRGPSVHLNFQQPENVNAEWYYNEVTVPKGEDILGSYFMANGFGEGYFGMQVNGPNERRILFSVWSPFNTDDPKSIPESHQIKMLKKGENVHTGEFGNEGSGGQSYLKYMWKAGNTYKFLLHGVPAKDSTTNYTAYFFAPETNQWQLIASFKRPKTQTYLKRFHSFLENFSPVQGDLSRKVLFNNQWICDDHGNWIELKDARFTTDNTGAKGYRMDYAGGVDNGVFYLKNGGFFNQYTTPRKIFTRTSMGKKPEIDFNKLP